MLVASYRFGAVLLECGLAVHAGIAAAQNYPAKPVRIVVPFGTGGSTDAVFRILGPRLAEGLGQQVVIDNRPGAAGSIGIGFVAKSPADGYTLGVSTLKRDPTLPDVPTIDEAGVPGYEVYERQGVVVPAGTPAAIINRLQQEIVKALPDVKERIAGVGARAIGSTPEELAAHIKRELAIWEKVVKAAGIRAD